MTDAAALPAGPDGAPFSGHAYDVESAETVYHGKVFTVRRDRVRMPGGGTAQRDVVVHPGAVGVIALDEANRVMMIRQYRHPVGMALWELPAGLLDVTGEPASAAAARELGEETGLRAADWSVLVDLYSSPGMTDEAVRVFLARGITEIPPDARYERIDEESDMDLEWVDLDDAVFRVLQGEIQNSLAVAGLLAAARARDRDWALLRPLDAPWPARIHHAG